MSALQIYCRCTECWYERYLGGQPRFLATGEDGVCDICRGGKPCTSLLPIEDCLVEVVS